MERRLLLAGLGMGTITLVAGCADSPSSTASPNHLVSISNRRETSHDVFVELQIDGEEHEYGPEKVVSGSDWDVETIDSTGTLTVQVYVDEELVWDDTHDIPTPGENRNSYVIVWLESDGEVNAFVEVED